MASYLNKLANSASNTVVSSIVGRGTLQKLANSINSVFVTSKYRDYMRSGNTIQIIAKSSRMALQMCASQNDPSRIVLLGNGQIGPEYGNSHFVIEVDEKSNNLRFRNFRNFLGFDRDIPCVFAEPLNPNDKKAQLRTKIEFRLHEVIGSDEYFSLESVYSPGRYLAVTPDGSITMSRNKTDDTTQFCIHVIHVLPDNIRGNLLKTGVHLGSQYTTPVGVGGPEEAAAATATTPPPATTSGGNYHHRASAPPPVPPPPTNPDLQFRKTAEVEQSNSAGASTSSSTSTAVVDTPPNYTNLFPQLPKLQ